MNAYIKSILVFNKNGKKREVNLKPGLNIITGESKSGKSALLEIVDYCMASSRSYIPKGVITDYTYLYVVIFHIGSYYLVMGRKNYEDNGNKNMYVLKMNSNYDIRNLSLNLFNEEVMISIERAKHELETSLGMNISDMTKNNNGRKEGKPSIRNMTSFIFQHQNLIANKFALFYRFDDYYKKEDVIKQFPIFAGWVDQEYYSLQLQLDELEKNKKRNERDQKSFNNAVEKLRGRLINNFINYYSLIGKKFDETNPINKLLKLRHQLPDYTRDSYLSDALETRYFNLKEKQEQKKQEKHEIDLKIKNLELNQRYGDGYKHNLEELKQRIKYSKPNKNSYNCPVCGKEHESINNKIEAINLSKEWLQSEIKNVGGQNDTFIEEINHLTKKKRRIIEDLKGIGVEIDRIESMFSELKISKRLNEQVIYYKAKIDTDCDIIEHQKASLEQVASNEYDRDIAEVRRKINGYNVDNYLSEASTFINKNINRIIESLDFEEEYRPTNLKFELETFNLYHHDQKNKSKIYLSEMGSGANWLSCHLSLFLSLLHFFAVEENSVIPSFLFIDQPSQVYFPPIKMEYVDLSVKEKDPEVITVEQMYITILDEIELIYESAGFRPQVIVTDHVDHMDLGDYDFKDYVRNRWRGEKFI